MGAHEKPTPSSRSLLHGIALDQCTFEHEFFSNQMALRAPRGKVFSVNGRFSAFYRDTNGNFGNAESRDEYFASNPGTKEELRNLLISCRRHHENDYYTSLTEPWLKLSDEEYWGAFSKVMPADELTELLRQDEEEFWDGKHDETSIFDSFEGKWLLFEPEDKVKSGFSTLTPDNLLDFNSISVASVSARVSGAGNVSILNKELSPFPDNDQYLMRDPRYIVTLGQWIVKLTLDSDQASLQLIDEPEDDGFYIPRIRNGSNLIVPYPNQDPTMPGYDKDEASMRALVDVAFDFD